MTGFNLVIVNFQTENYELVYDEGELIVYSVITDPILLSEGMGYLRYAA